MNRLISIVVLWVCFCVPAKAQYTTEGNAHSHNDYEHDSPFYDAYLHHFGSIEADIWAVGGELFVAHNRSEVKPERTIDSLYLNPIVTTFRQNGGKAWKDSPFSYQLLVDIKTDVEPALTLLIKKMEQFPEVFDSSVNKNAIRVVITGNRPLPSAFKNYPAFIFFDGKLNLRYDNNQLRRVALFSENLKDFTHWNGKTDIPEKEKKRLTFLIDSVHHLNKKIRFWNAPDMASGWRILETLNVDYINTDKISEMTDFFKK